MSTEPEPELTQGYQVQVDDNFHFMREDERWVLGNFATYEEALAASKGLVEAFFSGASVGKTADELYEGFVAVGDDPFIVPFGGAPPPAEHFSAWDYAKEYAARLAVVRDFAEKCSERLAANQSWMVNPAIRNRP